MAALGIQSMVLPTSYGGASIEWVNNERTGLTNDHTIGFVEEVAVIWHVNITKNYRIIGLAPIHIVLYIKIVRIWYNVRISTDYSSYIVRISRKRKR